MRDDERVDNAEVDEPTGKPDGFRPDPGFPERRPRAFPARAALTGVALFELGLMLLKLFTEGAWAALPFAVLFAAVAALSRLAPPARRPGPREGGLRAGERQQKRATARGLFDTTAVLSIAAGRYDGEFRVECARPDQDARLAEVVVRVTVKRTERSVLTGNRPAVTHWAVTVRAGTTGEAWGLLRAAEEQLPGMLAGVPDGDHSPRYFRLEGGRLADASAEMGAALAPAAAALAGDVARFAASLCAHEGAEPVDLLLTGERVGWLCPECGAALPADWGGA